MAINEIENKLEVEEEQTLEYQPTAKEAGDIEFALNFKNQCSEQTREERGRWHKSLERYNLSRNLSEYEYIDDIHIGLSYDAVERIATALPGREFGFRAKNKGKEDITNALLFSEILKEVWDSPSKMNGPGGMSIVKRMIGLFGSCPVQVYWDIKVDKNGNVIKSDPAFYPLNIFNFYANKFYSDIQHCPEVGYITEMSLDQFKKLAKKMKYKNRKYVKGTESGIQMDGNNNDSSTTDNAEGTASGDNLKIVKLFEIQSDDYILTIALDNKPIWLRKIPNEIGMKDIVMFRYKRNPMPNRLYGITDVERGGELEDSIQEAYNQMVFNHLLVDNPSFSYNKMDRSIDPRTFVTAPGAGIPRGSDPNSLTPIRFDSHLSESLATINNMLERYKRVVNVPDILAGVSDKGVDSATESNILDVNTKATFNSVVDEMKTTMYQVAEILKKLYEIYAPSSITIKVRTPELIEKFLDRPTTNEIMQNGIEMTVDKEGLVLDRDIEITVDNTTQNKNILSRRLIEFLNITTQDKLIPPELRILCYQQWLSLNDLEDLAMSFNNIVNKKQSSDTSLADQENIQMMNGKQLPPTPGATPAHTQRHIEFMRSNETGPEIDRLLDVHIKGEIAALQNAQSGGSPSQVGGEVSQPSIQTNEI